MIDIVRNRNCVYQTAYHVVWCPKDRCGILDGGVVDALDGLIDAICGERGWPVVSKKIRADHVHLCVSIPPATAVADAVKVLKGTSARRLFAQFPALKEQLRGASLWSPSYYVATVGNVSAENIDRYIERTQHVKGRR